MFKQVCKKILKHSNNDFSKFFYAFQTRNLCIDEKLIEVNDVNGVREIKMTSHKTRNVLSIPMMDELNDKIVEVAKNEKIRCIKISALGPVFSSGHNLKDLANGNEKLYIDTFTKGADLMLSIMEAPVPVIAVVNGLAAAAGCQLVASCDIVIASERSTFSTPGANFGIFCSNPGVAISRCISRKVAAHMLFTGLPITAQEALQFGLISKVCSEDNLDAEVELCINAIKFKSRSVIELGKKFFYSHLEENIRSAYSLGSQVMTDNLKLVDGQEGLKCFVEKRYPKWKNNFSVSEKFQ